MATEFFKRARLAPVRSDVSYIARNIVTGQGQFFEAPRDVPPLDRLRQIVVMLPSKRNRAFGRPMSFMINGKVVMVLKPTHNCPVFTVPFTTASDIGLRLEIKPEDKHN